MYCKYCGAETGSGNFCQYCGQPLSEKTPSVSLMNKAVSTANLDNRYNLVLVSCGSCSKVMTGDLLEDVFGYTDSESASLVGMAPVVVGERLTSSEAKTVAQLFTEYGVEISITDPKDQYVDLSGQATRSIFDSSGKLLAEAAAIIGALTVVNRISSFRRYKKPSLLQRIFHLGYSADPPEYRRNFRPFLEAAPEEPRRIIRRSQPIRAREHPFSGPGDTGHSSPRSQQRGLRF